MRAVESSRERVEPAHKQTRWHGSRAEGERARRSAWALQRASRLGRGKDVFLRLLAGCGREDRHLGSANRLGHFTDHGARALKHLARKDSQRRWKQAQTEHRLVSSTQAPLRLGARAVLCLSRDLVALSRQPSIHDRLTSKPASFAGEMPKLQRQLRPIVPTSPPVVRAIVHSDCVCPLRTGFLCGLLDAIQRSMNQAFQRAGDAEHTRP